LRFAILTQSACVYRSNAAPKLASIAAADRAQLRADIVEDGCGNAQRIDRGHGHGDEAAERSADEDRLRQLELVEQLDHVIGISERHVARWDWVVVALAAATEVEDDDPETRTVTLGEIGEVARVAGQAMQAQQRRMLGAAGIVAIVQHDPVPHGIIAIGVAHLSADPCCVGLSRPPTLRQVLQGK
jgi:hypothetical protein